MADLKRSLIRNTLFNVLGYCWTMVLGFLVTPVLIHFTGLRDYGLYILLGTLLSWIWILDLGLSTAATRFLSIYASSGEERRYSKCLSTTIVVKSIVGLAISALVLVATGPISRLMGFTDPAHDNLILQIMTLTHAISNLSQALNAGLAARQRMDIPNRIGLALSIPITAMSVLTLVFGWGLPGFLAANLISSLIYLALSWRSLIKYCPHGNAPSFRFSLDEWRQMLSFSKKQTINRLADSILATADRLALGNQLQAVSLYQLGATIVGRIREFTALTVSAAIPAGADLYAREDWAGMNQLFQRGTKYLLLLGLPLMTYAALFAEEVLTLWIGNPLPESAWIIRLLAPGYTLNVVAAMAASVAAAANRPDLQVRSSLLALTAALTVYLSWGFSRGMTGVAVSISAGYAVLGLAMLASLHHAMRGRLMPLPWKALLPTLVSLIAAVLAVGAPAKWFSLASGWVHNRGRGAVFIAITAAAASFAYVVCLKFTKALDEQDVKDLKTVFHKEPLPPGEGHSK